MKKVTIYTTSDFMGSIVKCEGTLISCGIQKYAQFDRCPFVKYVPKGKRNPAGFCKTFQPYLLIIDGWNHPNPDDLFNEGVTNADGVTIKESRYMSFDERYKTDFDLKIRDYLLLQQTKLIILDYRHTVGTEIIPQNEVII